MSDEVQPILSRMSNPTLLKTFAVLTHRMHAARAKRDTFKENELRIQRNTVEDEILRRMTPEKTEEPHFIAVNVSRDENGQKMSWDVARCTCDRPWRHGDEYLI